MGNQVQKTQLFHVARRAVCSSAVSQSSPSVAAMKTQTAMKTPASVQKVNIMPEGSNASFSGHDYRALDLLRAARSPPTSQAQQNVATTGLVFEISLGWIVGALQNTVVGFIRNALYTYRPLILLFGMGQLM